MFSRIEQEVFEILLSEADGEGVLWMGRQLVERSHQVVMEMKNNLSADLDDSSPSARDGNGSKKTMPSSRIGNQEVSKDEGKAIEAGRGSPGQNRQGPRNGSLAPSRAGKASL